MRNDHVLLITGMQRSGTSLVCQLLRALGVPFGDPADLLPGDRWNVQGYFEARPVMDLNSRIITGLDRHGSHFVGWLSKVAYLRMPDVAAIERRGRRHRDAIHALAERYRGCAVKDPRFCLTLRYWREQAPVGMVLVCLRQPAAVVDSMVRRHWLPRGIAARFYAWHIDALVAQLPAGRALFVDVDRLALGDAGELDSLRQALDLAAGPPSAALLRELVKPEQVGAPPPGTPCPPIAQAAWERLVRLVPAR